MVRPYLAWAYSHVELFQDFQIQRLSSRPSSHLKKIWPPSSDTSNSGMMSRPSIEPGRASHLFLCVMPRGSTASSAVSL